METLLSVEEAAAMLKMTKTALYAAAKRRELPAFKLARRWKFPAQALQKWISDKANAPLNEKTS